MGSCGLIPLAPQINYITKSFIHWLWNFWYFFNDWFYNWAIFLLYFYFQPKKTAGSRKGEVNGTRKSTPETELPRLIGTKSQVNISL